MFSHFTVEDTGRGMAVVLVSLHFMFLYSFISFHYFLILNIKLECLSNQLELFHLSIGERVHRKCVERPLKKTLEAHYCAIHCRMQY